MIKKLLIIFLILSSMTLAEVTLIQPVKKTISNNLYLGQIAPGQELKLVFSRETGPDGNKKAIFWEKALIPKKILINQTMEGDKIISWIRAPENIRGNYTFNITLQGDLLYIMPETKQLTMQVTENVYELTYQKSFTSKAGETIQIPITIKSNSIAKEELKLTSSQNFPLKWTEFPKTIFQGKGTKQVMLKLKPTEEGDYNITLKIGRKSSNLINLINIKLRTYPTIKSKLKAFEEGFSITPIIMQPFYSFLSLIGYY